MAATRLGRRWAILALPASYLFHLGEEWWAGEGFTRWTARLAGTPVSASRFLWINGIAFPLFLLGTLLAIRTPRGSWFAVTFSALLVLNGLLHLLGTIATETYSPGLVTGLALYVPLGVVILRAERSHLPAATFARAVLGGVALHGVVALAAFWNG